MRRWCFYSVRKLRAAGDAPKRVAGQDAISNAEREDDCRDLAGLSPEQLRGCGKTFYNLCSPVSRGSTESEHSRGNQFILIPDIFYNKLILMIIMIRMVVESHTARNESRIAC